MNEYSQEKVKTAMAKIKEIISLPMINQS